MKPILDDVLKDWGENIYRTSVRVRISKRTVTHSRTSSLPPLLQKVGSARIRNALAMTTSKAPEVMVKISGGGKGMRHIKAHFDYISRNGKLELENENGEIIAGRESIRDLRDEWKYGQYGIPEEARYKEAFNVVLSMPPGTDRDAVTQAARDFAHIEFADNHAYVFTAHDDERHPHVHLCIKALGRDGTRLNPRKADLQRWRERFAETLRERGIVANATPRTARAAVHRGEKQAVHHMRRRGRVFETAATDVSLEQIQNSSSGQQRVIHAYGQIARELAQSDSADRKLALAITSLVAQMPMVSMLRKRTQESRHMHVKSADQNSLLNRNETLDQYR